MNQSLYTKLVAIVLVIVSALMLVAGVFLTRSVRGFYLSEFYEQMQEVFSRIEVAEDLRTAADSADAEQRIVDIIKVYVGNLGINSRTRNYYILDGDTGALKRGSTSPENGIKITPNIVTAINGKEGFASDPAAEYMDVAIPISGEGGKYIIYIVDNKNSVLELNRQLFQIIIEALAIGMIIAVMLGLLLAKTMISPIQDLTDAAKKVASGDFSDKIENSSKDEIGVLATTFNDMASKLEGTLNDLKKSEQMRREFVANVSHELRTPITSVRSYAETLAEDPHMPAETRERFLEVILNESDRMTKIVQDLLTLSRFDAGSIEFSFKSFSFEKSVRDVYSAMAMEAQSHHHEFILDIQPGIPEIRGDKARVEQVLINMASNAIKYTKDGGKIRMTAGFREGEVWCAVRDNGIGIPKDDVDRVFDRFYRVDKARSRESGGTGLGLSIASEIVSRHEGKINIQSREGKGTTITVWLPAMGPAGGDDDGT